MAHIQKACLFVAPGRERECCAVVDHHATGVVEIWLWAVVGPVHPVRKRAPLFFECFPQVCPEPVLAHQSFLVTYKMAQKICVFLHIFRRGVLHSFVAQGEDVVGLGLLGVHRAGGIARAVAIAIGWREMEVRSVAGRW